jgi:hypothetical protein
MIDNLLLGWLWRWIERGIDSINTTFVYCRLRRIEPGYTPVAYIDHVMVTPKITFKHDGK